MSDLGTISGLRDALTDGHPLLIHDFFARKPLMPIQNPRFLKLLRAFSMIEGTSTLILFGIAMPLKYMAGMPMAVRIVGSLHGFLFVGLAILFAMAVRMVPLPAGLAFRGILASMMPFGPFVFDRRLKDLSG